MLATIQDGIKEDVEQWDSNNLQEQKKVEIKKEKPEDYYILGEELGKGKFGVVYKCVDKVTNKEYAAKYLKCRSAQKKTILNEIDILNTLHHKLIVDLVAAFEAPRLFVLVFELISGGELFEKLTEEDIISEAEVIFYIRQLVCAVKHFHDNEILHLDLKPENIMLVAKGSTQIKLIDFGLAARADKSDLKVMFGTPEFVAPEVINYDCVSYETDMWSVGVITYLLLSGYTPFEGESDQDTLVNITLGEWDFEVEAFDEVSSEAKDFIKNLIVKKKDKRARCDECLKDPWLKVFKQKRMKKSIRTANLASFMAKRRWKKSLTAIKAGNFLSKIANLAKSEGTDLEEDIEDDSSNLEEEDGSDLSEEQGPADDQSKIDEGISV